MSLANTLSPPNVTPESVTDTVERQRRWLRRMIWSGCLLAVAAVVTVVVHPLFVRWQLKQHGWSIGNELPHGGVPSWCPKFVATWFGRVDYANIHRTPLPEDVKRLRSFPHLSFLEFQNTDVSEATLEATSHLPQVRNLVMSGGRVDDAGLGYLASLPQLERLELMRVSPLSAKALENIAKYQALERLEVLQSSIDEEGLVHLQKLRRLWSLYLSDTNVGDRGFENVSRCVELRRLGLDGLLMTDDSMKCFSRLTKLESLEITECNLTDVGIKELIRHTRNLTTLRLNCPPMTDDALADIGSLPSLRELSLGEMPITIRGILQLKKQTTLQSLRLWDTKVIMSVEEDKMSVEELKRANSNLEIQFQ